MIPTQAFNDSANLWIVFFSPLKQRRLLGAGRCPAKTLVSAQGPSSPRRKGSNKVQDPSLSPQVCFTLHRRDCLDQIEFLFLALCSLCWHLTLSVNLKLSRQLVFVIYLCVSGAPQG